MGFMALIKELSKKYLIVDILCKNFKMTTIMNVNNEIQPEIKCENTVDLIALSNYVFGDTVPLGGEELDLLDTLLLEQASPVPLIPGML